MADTNTLTPRQLHFLREVAAGSTVAQAAKAAGYWRTSGYKLLHSPAAQAEIAQLQEQAALCVARELDNIAEMSLQELRRGLSSNFGKTREKYLGLALKYLISPLFTQNAGEDEASIIDLDLQNEMEVTT